MLNSIPIFKKYFSSDLIKRLSSLVKEVNFSPGDILYKNEKKGIGIYFIYEGAV